jgi:hypothetical protein
MAHTLVGEEIPNFCLVHRLIVHSFNELVRMMVVGRNIC